MCCRCLNAVASGLWNRRSDSVATCSLFRALSPLVQTQGHCITLWTLAANKVAYQSSALMNRVQCKNRYKDTQSECKLSQATVALALGNVHPLLSVHIAVSAHVQNSYLQFVDGYFSNHVLLHAE